MDLVQVLILSGFGIGNLVGFILWIIQYFQESHKVAWNKDPDFWGWAVMTLLFGITYVILQLIIWVKRKI